MTEHAPLDVSVEEQWTQPNAPHLIHLPGGSFNLWRCCGIRGAGFPVDGVLSLAASDVAETGDRCVRAARETERARIEALRAVNQALDALRGRGEWDDAAQRTPLVTALRNLKQEVVPPPLDTDYSAAEPLESYRAANEHFEAAQQAFYEAFPSAIGEMSKSLYAVAGTDRYQEAVIWQNRRAFHTGVKAYLRHSPESARRNSQRRQHEELIAQYLQRYATKNDTIGFFGPVGWGTFTSSDRALTVRPGHTLLASRTVYFETWGIEALAETIAQDDELRPWCTPRRVPYVALEGTELYVPGRAPMPLPVEQAAVLDACDGSRTAGELYQDPALQLDGARDVYAVLAQFEQMGLISWGFAVPRATQPAQHLRAQFEKIGKPDLRASALAALDELETARVAVAEAAGDAGALDRALGELEHTFTHLTGTDSTRAAGQQYAGRTLVYEDCRRDLDVAFGRQILRNLGPALSLVLQSARWLTTEVATHYRQRFNVAYDELASKLDSDSISLATFFDHIDDLILGDETPVTRTLIPELQRRWSAILVPAADRHRMQFSSEALRDAVMTTFDASAPGWPSARYHSPDIMIAAADAESIRHGDYQLVLGELHLGLNALATPIFWQQHPAPQRMFDWVDRDLPTPRIVPLAPKNLAKVTTRTRQAVITDKDFGLLFSTDAYDIPRTQVLPIGELVVERDDAGLCARTRVDRLCVDILDVFTETLSWLQLCDQFTLLQPHEHLPRISIDRFVINRESWRFAADDIEFAHIQEEADRFLEARRWADVYEIPRFVFVKTPVEPKPFYVDFESPVLINILAKSIRRALREMPDDPYVTVTEMLPDPTTVWLPDGKGRRYTSEFRIVAVDTATVEDNHQ